MLVHDPINVFRDIQFVSAGLYMVHLAAMGPLREDIVVAAEFMFASTNNQR